MSNSSDPVTSNSSGVDVNTILLIVNMVLSTIVPILSNFLVHIRYSSCWGAQIVRDGGDQNAA
jgi:hypothetical protein